LRTMSLDQLANRLDDRFRLLTSGSRTALPRHRTLRAVVDWSWELLTDAERIVLRRLAVFSGGASLDAAEQVCAGDSVERGEVLELLTSLTEKSLLLTEGDSAPRYRMLDTIKEYTRDRLAQAGESDLARHAHLAYFTGLAETADPHLRRAGQLEWLGTLEVEHDNIAVALRGALAAGEAHGAMRLAAAAGWYWWLGGHKAEGIELITAAANTPGEVSDDIRAMVYALGVTFMTSGPVDEYQAEEWIHKAYRFTQRSQRRNPLLGFVAPLERMLQAPHAFLPAFEPLLTDDDPWVRALARLHLRAVTHDLLGYLAGSLDEAREHRVAAFQAASEAGHAPVTARVLVGIADLALRGERYEQAARLLAASAGVRGLPDRSQPDVARIEQATRRRLGEARFAEATQEGAQASWRELAEATLAC
jgi:hypothetical protein